MACHGTFRVGFLKGSARALPLSRRSRGFPAQAKYYQVKIPRGLPQGFLYKEVIGMGSKILGGTLLIVGTSLGAGMLALPLVTAGGGYFHSLWLFFGMWLVTVFAAFLLLEVNLWFPERSNLISMARDTLGVPGQIVTWLSYLLLLYSLLAAYIAGGSDLLQGLFSLMHFSTPLWLDSVIFTLLLGAIVFNDILFVDWANRGLMTIKMLAYVILIALITPHVHFKNLAYGHFKLLSSAVMVVVTAFGYSVIIPSLRTYFNSNVKALRITIALGSLLALMCYLAWDFVVQGSLASAGAGGLVRMAISGHATSDLTAALSTQLHSTEIAKAARVFTTVCVTTSFLGVALCLTDFLADGMQVRKVGMSRWLVMLVTFGPPLAVIILYPAGFILGLRYAGVFCVILLILTPMLMTYSGRYVKKIASGYRVWGGWPVLSFSLIVAFVLLVYGVVHVF